MEGSQFPVALDAATRTEVHIDEACSIFGERPNYVCMECGHEVVAHCRTKRAPGFAHRIKNTSCLGRRPSPSVPEAPPTEASPPSEGWAPAPLAPAPVPPVAAQATPWSKGVVLPHQLPKPPPAPSRQVSQPADEAVSGVHWCVGEVYFHGRRCLQLLAIYQPAESTPPGAAGGALTWYTRTAESDPFSLNGRELKRWTHAVTKPELLAVLEAELRRVKESLLEATESAAQAPFRRASRPPRPNSEPLLPPLRGPGWTPL